MRISANTPYAHPSAARSQEINMFEISKTDDECFDYYLNERTAYRGGIYDFTFENRYIIYHAPLCNEIIYFAIDKKTNLSSEVIRRDDGEYAEDEYTKIFPYIYKSLRYTGERRSSDAKEAEPSELIDTIFRTILTQYGYAVREEQIALSKQMYTGLTQKKVSLCEAEVGSGKSLAYLIAGVAATRGNRLCRSTVTISTSGIELQNALVEKEIPALSRVLMECHIIDHPLTAVLRKGKEHYFCCLRFTNYFNSILKSPKKYERQIRYFTEQNMAERAFDLDRYKISGSVKDKICVKSCHRCPYRSNCKYRRFIRAALDETKSLDFQVTNHNLFLMSARQPGLLRSSGFVIIDEAHKLTDAAKDVYGSTVSQADIERYLNYVRADKCIMEKNAEFASGLSAVRTNAAALFELLCARRDEDDYEAGESSIVAFGNTAVEYVRNMIFGLKLIESSRRHGYGKFENSGRNLIKRLETFCTPSVIFAWLESGENGKLTLCCSPKNTGAQLRRYLWKKNCSYVLTSGTMSDGSSFEFFKRENGLGELGPYEIQESVTPSPFDYSTHTRLYIPTNLPFPDNNDKNYINSICEQIVKIVRAANGHTAILFTSYKVLAEVYEKTKDRLSGYELICMSRSNRTAIADFKKSRNAVLYASGPMWEGVDCAGDTLSSLIIVRLPFPIRSAVMRQKQIACDNVTIFIQEYAVPEMLIKLRQGIGRLIRSEYDTGLISILDSRASTGKYAERIADVFKKYPVIYSTDEIEAFFREVKPKEYYNNTFSNTFSKETDLLEQKKEAD